MKLGMMQPYFFPYIGYFQLLNMVDKYVVFDSANYIKNGWVNRNRILVNGAPDYFRASVRKASQNKLINEIEVSNDEDVKTKNIHTLEFAYKKAPFYAEVMPLLERFLMADYDNLAEINVASNKLVCDYLGIQTEIMLFSELDTDKELKREYRIYDVCKTLGADEYVNAIGGTELYDFEEFKKRGIKLSFLKADPIEYEQFGKEFVPSLSIIDVMMFNSVPQIQDMMNKYTLITENT